MQRIRRFIALLLLAVWLPATLHCGAEAAGFAFGTDCCAETSSHHSSSGAEGCELDGCETVEGGFTSSSVFSVAAPALASNVNPLWTLDLIPALAPLSPPVTGVVEASSAPPELSHSWVFVRRAALLPGAPSLV